MPGLKVFGIGARAENWVIILRRSLHSESPDRDSALDAIYSCLHCIIITFAVLGFERKACTFGAHMETAVVRLGGIHKLYTGAFLPSF